MTIKEKIPKKYERFVWGPEQIKVHDPKSNVVKLPVKKANQ